MAIRVLALHSRICRESSIRFLSARTFLRKFSATMYSAHGEMRI